jgi:hypothetical protein
MWKKNLSSAYIDVYINTRSYNTGDSDSDFASLMEHIDVDKILSSPELDATSRRSSVDAVYLVVALMHACMHNAHVQERACAHLAGMSSRSWDAYLHRRVYACVMASMRRHHEHRGVQEMGCWVLSKLTVDPESDGHVMLSAAHVTDHEDEDDVFKTTEGSASDDDLDLDLGDRGVYANHDALFGEGTPQTRTSSTAGDTHPDNTREYSGTVHTYYNTNTDTSILGISPDASIGYTANAASVCSAKNESVITAATRVVIAAMRTFLCDARVQERACAALGNLASGGGDCKERMLCEGAVGAVVSAMHVHEGDARVQVCIHKYVCKYVRMYIYVCIYI